MSGFRRYRLSSLPCVVALMLAVALLMNPVLVTLGDFHIEVEHSSGNGVLYEQSASVQLQSDDSGSRLLDTLLHIAHSGGASLATLPDFPVIPATPAAKVRIPGEVELLPSSPRQAPYRPPITA